MGYTHYWRKSGDLCPEAWAAFLRDVRAILKASGRLVAGEDGTGKPEVGPDRVVLNGKGPDAYETFAFERRASHGPGEDFDFCKTARKSYDKVVTAILLAAADAFAPALRVSSDGGWEEWLPGRTLHARATGRTAPCPWR